MHPATRVLLVIALATVLARASMAQVAIAGVLVAGLLPWRDAPGWRRLARGLWQLKFLFLSIAVLYLFLTPGQALWPGGEPGAVPSREGLAEGLLRVFALAALVAAVHWLMRSQSRADLIAGLGWVLRPLRLVGLDVDRVAVRLVLTLETVPRLRVMVAATRRDWARGSPWRQPAVFGARVFARAMVHAERRPPPRVWVPHDVRPPLWQLTPVVGVTAALLFWF
ncbi:energy-coupling factor transport system permease protein [Alkalispirillum mobile]|uniref:Energy-coupling factor transport system permease protein n=1 Tax=Alkalispirillum mobile TaxID=85925 RepID=A0A498CD95_9GAMM|nr:hypothetical protein [Alkalispirillum mobile]RLK50201.1 energy-coupling factor transport system permease protein [Alkalispirillum mobile]